MLAGDNGQQTKANSTSVVEASDSPLVVAQDALNAKLPAAAASGDTEDNATTTTTVRSRIFGFNGTSWDRIRTGITALVSTFVGFVNAIPYAKYNATPATRTDGNGGTFEADVKGNLRITEQAPPAYENVADAAAQVHAKPATSAAFNAIPFDNAAKAAAGIIKAAPGNLYRLYVAHDNAAATTFAVLNKATTPITGDTAIFYFKCPPGVTTCIEFTFGKRFSTGIAWAYCGVNLMTATITLGAAEACVTAECS